MLQELLVKHQLNPSPDTGLQGSRGQSRRVTRVGPLWGGGRHQVKRAPSAFNRQNQQTPGSRGNPISRATTVFNNKKTTKREQESMTQSRGPNDHTEAISEGETWDKLDEDCRAALWHQENGVNGTGIKRQTVRKK